MSILIKGMEMPKAGELLCIDILPDGKVYIHLDLENKQIATAVPIPPHGRLIDADALFAVMKKERDRIARVYGDNDEFAQCLTKYGMSMVLSAPTIIPADPPVMYYPQVPGITPTVITEEGE